MKIVLLSDTHVGAHARAFNANLNVVLQWIREERPDLIIHLGDVTADGVVAGADLSLAARMFADLPMPCYFLPGNHDIGDNPAGPDRPAEPPVDAARLSDFRHTLGSDWWSLPCGHWQLLGLNALLFGTGSEEEERQFTWLETQLAQARGPLGVLLHKPLFRNGPQDREVHDRYVPWLARERLLGLVQRRDLRFVLSGHVHQFLRLPVAGVEHIWLPSTSFCIPDTLQERIGCKQVGVGVLHLHSGAEVSEGHFDFEVVIPRGLVCHNLMDHAEVYPIVAELKMRHTTDPSQ